MKRVWMLLVLFGVLGFTGMVSAALWDRGGGLIYDDVLNVTWLQDANYAKTSGDDADGRMTWSAAMTWAANLTYHDTVRDVTYDDWRLPTTVDGVWEQGYNGLTSAGWNITSSELGYMYYVNLGNKGYYATDGTSPQPGWNIKNSGSFVNWQGDGSYWSGTGYSWDSTNRAWYFYNPSGSQSIISEEGNSIFVWAVRNGDVVDPPAPIVTTPVPGTMLLACSGLAGLGLIRKTRRSHG